MPDLRFFLIFSTFDIDELSIEYRSVVETNARLLVKEGIGHIPIIDLQQENFRSIVESALNMVTLG